jgi:hypothetical protein
MAALVRAAGQTRVTGARVIAKTLPEESASTRILAGIGMKRVGTELDAQHGEVWVWEAA